MSSRKQARAERAAIALRSSRQARAERAAIAVAGYVDRVVAKAPPLTPSQFDRIALLLKETAA